MTKIVVVIAAYNRKEKTLQCLRSLYSKAIPDLDIMVHLLDDASTDGTSAAVKSLFPQVNIISGTGGLYWGGGMARAMAAAAQEDFDFMLWLNDDVQIHADALPKALHAFEHLSKTNGQSLILAGPTTNDEESEYTYSAFRRKSRLNPSSLLRVKPAADPIPVDTINGNFVLIPQSVVNAVGIIDPNLIHQLGDIDYGFRAAKQNVTVILLNFPIGKCDANPSIVAPWLQSEHSINKRIQILFSPKGLPAKSWLIFMGRHGGGIAIAILAGIYLKELFKIFFCKKST